MPRVRTSPFDSLRHSRNPALQHEVVERLHAQFQAKAEDHDTVDWLKTGFEYPSYDDLAFGYHGNVFSIKIYECDTKGESALAEEEIARMQSFAKENNLIPCGYPVDIQTHEPLEPGWNLLSLLDGSSVDPTALPPNPQATLSAWEKQSLQTMLAAKWLVQNRRGEIQNVCTIPGAVPQFFFQDGNGNRCWALVQENATPPDLKALLKDYPALQDADGYLGVVKLSAPADEGLLRMNLGKTATEFGGLKRIYLAPASSLLSSEEEAELLGKEPPELPAEQLEEEVSGKGCLLFLVGALAVLLGACAFLQ